MKNRPVPSGAGEKSPVSKAGDRYALMYCFVSLRRTATTLRKQRTILLKLLNLLTRTNIKGYRRGGFPLKGPRKVLKLLTQKSMHIDFLSSAS